MDSIIISYRSLRRLIGFLAFLLPLSCLIGGILSKHGIQPNISAYYYTNMQDVFVGILFGISLFCITYFGYSKLDNIITTLIGISGIIIALVPASTVNDGVLPIGVFQLPPFISGWIHLFFATTFFLLLSYNCIFLFTRTGNKETMTDKKKLRNLIYISCGLIMAVGFIILSVMTLIISRVEMQDNVIILIIEFIMLYAFGTSWLVKGESIFGDKE